MVWFCRTVDYRPPYEAQGCPDARCLGYKISLQNLCIVFILGLPLEISELLLWRCPGFNAKLN